MKTKGEAQTWLYDGDPMGVEIVVPDATPNDGGYIMLVQLDSARLRMFATRFPGRCVSTWNSNANKCGGESIQRVIVSAPHIRYERIKRLAQETIDPDNTDLTIEHIRDRVAQMLSLKLVALPKVGARFLTV